MSPKQHWRRVIWIGAAALLAALIICLLVASGAFEPEQGELVALEPLGQADVNLGPSAGTPEEKPSAPSLSSPHEGTGGSAAPPAGEALPSAVVVVVGGDGNHRIGLREAMPRIWEEIGALGSRVGNLRSMWVQDRPNWLAELLTGHAVAGMVRYGGACEFRSPTVCELFRHASHAPAQDCWIIAVGDDDTSIILCDRDSQAGFSGRFSPVVFSECSLNLVDAIASDLVGSLRAQGTASNEIPGQLLKTLTPAMLGMESDSEDSAVPAFMTRVVAEHGGEAVASDGFLRRLGARLLADPAMAPRLAIFRFGGIPELREEERLDVRNELIARKARLHSEACLDLWRAFKGNPMYREGTFIVIHEMGGAVFVGPKVRVGAVTTGSYFLCQMLPTIAKILGYDQAAFVAPCRNPPRKGLIEEVFTD